MMRIRLSKIERQFFSITKQHLEIKHIKLNAWRTFQEERW